jgi:hypothetical protein
MYFIFSRRFDKSPGQKFIKIFLAITLINILLFSCSSSEDKEKTWEPVLDQGIPGRDGRLDFGRTHYVVHQRESMNAMRENQIKAFLAKACHPKKAKVMRRFQSESDFVSLRVQYRDSLPVIVYEFNCR